MRTIRYTWVVKADQDTEIRVETEVIVGDDGDAREAGRDARRVFDEFISGTAEDTESA